MDTRSGWRSRKALDDGSRAHRPDSGIDESSIDVRALSAPRTSHSIRLAKQKLPCVMGSESGFFFYDSQLFLCRSVQRLIKGAFQFRYLPRFPQSMQSSQNYRPVCEILVPARGTKQRMDNALPPLSVERKSGNSSQHSTIIVQRPVWSICRGAFASLSRVGAG